MTGDILIVEDEPKLARLLADYATAAGFRAFCLGNGKEVVPWVQARNPDLILLDLMLPGRDGIDVCKEIRMFSQVPVIIATARIEEIDRLLGLELGADDYVCKPYSPREVMARVKAVLRRVRCAPIPQVHGLVLDDGRYQAVFESRNLGLTAVEFRLLQFLVSNPGRLYGRQELMAKIYPDERNVSDRTIDSHVKRLRRKIETVNPRVRLIHSVYGVGYKFEPDYSEDGYE